MAGKTLWGLLKSAASKWNDHNVPRLGAALAYYSLLSMAPLLIVILQICALVLTKTTAENELLRQVYGLAGPSAVQTVRTLIENAHKTSGVVATAIAVVALIFGASGVFVELRDSLNTIWDAPKNSSTSWRSLLWQRMVSFGMVLALGFLLLVSLVLSAAITVVEKFFADTVPMHYAIFGEIANFLISLGAIGALFALIFKFVPDVPIHWRDVGIGAIVTAVLFSIGKALLALYLGTAAVGSAYGAAGSLVAFVVWVYYSAQIFFFGAIFTRVYADMLGSQAPKSEPNRGAKFSAAAGS
jgi:membrane protein